MLVLQVKFSTIYKGLTALFFQKVEKDYG